MFVSTIPTCLGASLLVAWPFHAYVERRFLDTAVHWERQRQRTSHKSTGRGASQLPRTTSEPYRSSRRRRLSQGLTIRESCRTATSINTGTDPTGPDGRFAQPDDYFILAQPTGAGVILDREVQCSIVTTPGTMTNEAGAARTSGIEVHVAGPTETTSARTMDTTSSVGS